MVDGGRERALYHIQKNEEKGQAYNNPYAQAIYRRYVIPMAEILTEYLGEAKRGVQAAAKGLLREHDPYVLAFITVRQCITTANETEQKALASLAVDVGRTVYGETVLAAFEDLNPDLYYTLVHDFERRMSKSERHRLTVFRLQAEQNGIPLPHWDASQVTGVGTLLVGVARELGLIEVSQIIQRRKKKLLVTLHPEVAGILEKVTDFVAGASPMVLPCIEPPKPWVTPNDGGYHTQGMRRNAPAVIRGRAYVPEDDVPPVMLQAINRLQRDEWRINERILALVDTVSKHFDVGEVLSQAEYPKPDRPHWLTEDMTREDMSAGQLQAFAEWRAEVREWYTTQKLNGVKWGRYHEALRVARLLKDHPIYFVYQADFRGRLYANTRGVSPQGSDLQKALLHSGRAVSLGTGDGPFWFRVAGANRFGVDNVPLREREAWVLEHHDMILACANDPISHRQWTEADEPFQFIAWCMEYRDWQLYGEDFRTRLPLGQDGSCNGLQHFSAMLRDERGGRATNLVPGESKQDLYRMVSDRTTELIQQEDMHDDEQLIGARWKRHQLSRELVKRSVMTLPYGSTRYSCADFIRKEYLSKGKAPEFSKEEYTRSANWLSYRVWRAIGDVVVKAREAMEWLQSCVPHIVDSDTDEISWRSPSGLLVRQRYNKAEVIQINTRLIGGVRIRPSVSVDTEEPDRRKHRNGIAPNFVHACDASHVHFLIEAAEAAGISHLAVVHDDYGALAPDVGKLHKLIRETFVDLYGNHDPLQDFKDRHNIPVEIPDKGVLDITTVRDSVYFFS